MNMGVGREDHAGGNDNYIITVRAVGPGYGRRSRKRRRRRASSVIVAL